MTLSRQGSHPDEKIIPSFCPSDKMNTHKSYRIYLNLESDTINDNGRRKVNAIAQTFATAVNEIDDPRTSDVDYPLAEILFTALDT